MKSLIFTVSIVGFLSFYFLDLYTNDIPPVHLQDSKITYENSNYDSDEDIVLKSEDITLSTVTQSFDLNRTTSYKITALNDIKVVKILKELHSCDNDKNATTMQHVTQKYEQFTDIELASLLEDNLKIAS